MLRPKREQPVRARLLGGGAAAAAALPLLLDEDIDIHEGGAAPVRAAHEPTRQLQLPWGGRKGRSRLVKSILEPVTLAVFSTSP